MQRACKLAKNVKSTIIKSLFHCKPLTAKPSHITGSLGVNAVAHKNTKYFLRSPDGPRYRLVKAFAFHQISMS
jgi:hypothetical protein